jgi:hypothetical protein
MEGSADYILPQIVPDVKKQQRKFMEVVRNACAKADNELTSWANFYLLDALSSTVDDKVVMGESISGTSEYKQFHADLFDSKDLVEVALAIDDFKLAIKKLAYKKYGYYKQH